MASDRSHSAAERSASDAELIARAKERSPEAWSAIYDAHYLQLFRYCYARCGDDGAAAELAASVFVEAFEGIRRFEYRGRPLLAWLYRIAHNLVSDHLRARAREREALRSVAGTLDQHDPGPARAAADRADVLTALERLTAEQRQVIALRFYAGLATSEIAATMERSESAVYSLEARALAAMRRALTPEDADAR